MKILSPVRNMETLILAIEAGCDEVYFGAHKYSARSKASITIDEIKAMVNYAKRLEVKTFVAVNTLIDESIIDEVINLIDQLYLINVDGIIVQSVGLLFLKKYYPGLEFHASTQMHIHNVDAAILIQDDVDRIVFPRELSIEQIKQFDSINLDKEIFVHGALCSAISGQCFISHSIGDKSANHGNCSQICRKDGMIKKNGTIVSNSAVLSLKDLNASDLIKQLPTASLKIEGRLKSNTYIYASTKYYHDLIRNKEDLFAKDLMTIAFNREYTAGKLASANSIRSNRINNNGLFFGKVTSKTIDTITIQSDLEVFFDDTIRVVGKEELGFRVNEFSVKENEIVFKTFVDANIGDCCYIVKRPKEEKYLDNLIKKPLRKNQVDINLSIYNNKIKIYIKNLDLEFTSSIIAQDVINKPISLDQFLSKLCSTGNTLYDFNINIEKFSECFIPNSHIKVIRDEIITILDDYYLSNNRTLVTKNLSYDRYDNIATTIIYNVSTKEQEDYIKSFNHPYYVSNLSLLDASNLLQIPVLPRVIKTDEFDYYLNLVREFKTILVSDLGMINALKHKHLITNSNIHVASNLDQLYLKSKNVIKTCHSIESTQNLHVLANEKIIYGKQILMLFDVCPINPSKTRDCKDCTLCQTNTYEYIDDHNIAYALKHHGLNTLALYSHLPIDEFSNLELLKNYETLRIDLLDETIEDIKIIQESLINLLSSDKILQFSPINQ